MAQVGKPAWPKLQISAASLHYFRINTWTKILTILEVWKENKAWDKLAADFSAALRNVTIFHAGCWGQILTKEIKKRVQFTWSLGPISPQ